MYSKKFLSLFLIILAAISLTGCEGKQKSIQTERTEEVTEAAASETLPDEKSEVTIVYTNDIHSYVCNTLADDDGNELPGLRLSNVAALVEDLRAEGKSVLLVDAGDEIQGSVYGAFDQGVSVIELMNACDYQLATPGNHEFDYGMDTFFELSEQADYPFISCNFFSTEDNSQILPGTEIFDVNGTKIAFVGISSANTITTSTPVYFQDDSGNYLYSFLGSGDANDLYECVQKAVDSVRDEADYVVALSHMGVNSNDAALGVSSECVIANTTGIDAVIDGHSHTVMEGSYVENKDGEEVLLTQSGAYLTAIGVVTVSAGGDISSELITEYDRADSEVAALEQALSDAVAEQMGETVGELESTLYIFNPEKGEQRLIRSIEMNAGDFVADSVYWFLNDSLGQDCDIVIANGGGVRSQLEAGEVTYLDFVNICPFGNQICLIEATGQEILDALELGAKVAGLWDDERDVPAENGGFLHVAGLKYTVDASVTSSVTTDGNSNFVSVDGEYRVKDVMVYNRATGAYDALEPDKTYRLGGINYLLRDSGNGLAMFTDNPLILDFAGQDSVVLALYASSFAGADYPLICSENSPLYGLSGYEINYENPYGAGRITIENSAF